MVGELLLIREEGVGHCNHRSEPWGLEQGEMRCSCGSLLARLVAGGVELKCRRCKRTMVLPIEADERSGFATQDKALGDGRVALLSLGASIKT